MRWDHLFDDLASQFDAERDEELRRAAIDEERLRIARMTTRDRLLALSENLDASEPLNLQLHTGERIVVVPVEFGADWLGADLVGTGRSYSSCIVPLNGIAALLLTSQQVAASLKSGQTREGVAARLGIHLALRDLARRRVACELSTRSGVIYGTIDRVGRDHLDIAIHDPETARRAQAVAFTRILPIADLTLVRIRD